MGNLGVLTPQTGVSTLEKRTFVPYLCSSGIPNTNCKTKRNETMKKLLIVLFTLATLMNVVAQNEPSITHPESGEVTLYPAVVVPQFTLYEIYCAGNPLYMSLITLCLVGILLAAWKMPSCVKELGLLALVIGICGFLIGVFQANNVLMQAGDISPAVVCGGLMAAVIAPIWGLIVYGISLLIRIVQKPKTI